MWQLDNRTPFAAGQGWIRDRRGAETWLVVVKATFDINPDGRTTVASLQPEPVRVPQYHGDPGSSSLRLDNDFVLTKATTDVIVLGRACAPAGKAVTQIDVGMRVGEMHKALRVFGNRRWTMLGPSAPEHFESLPITYEHAFGGRDRFSDHPDRDWDWRNPVGRGFTSTGRNTSELALPNIEGLDRLMKSPNDRPDPAGFGVVAGHWQPRASLAGTYDAAWESSRQPLLPDDCSDRFFQCAPTDQQAPQFLVGGEPVSLVHLHPRGRIDFALPRMTLEMESRFADGERRPHAAPRLHTIILEPDLPRVSLVWHDALECHAKVHQLDSTRITWKSPEFPESDRFDVRNLLDFV